jgi:SPOR domain
LEGLRFRLVRRRRHEHGHAAHALLCLRSRHRPALQAILGGREPLVVRTTMGNAAIWHRISIAADTREAAETLCSRLRAAGGSCLVQSN